MEKVINIILKYSNEFTCIMYPSYKAVVIIIGKNAYDNEYLQEEFYKIEVKDDVTYYLEYDDKINSKSDFERLKKGLEIINNKLNNENFLKKAKPEIIELEKKKKQDFENKIKNYAS